MNRHGTLARWGDHQRGGEEPCEACRVAKSEYDKLRRTGTIHQERGRAAAQAQSRALRRLKRLHPDEYRALYSEERARVFAERGLSPDVIHAHA